MVDDAPYLVLAAQTRNSSAWPSRLPLLWPALEYDHVNTVEVPVYWNQVEAQPGKYDFSLVDMILSEARKHQVHVIPLWFATWKNGSQHFMPDWMKMDTVRYGARREQERGGGGLAVAVCGPRRWRRTRLRLRR